MSKKGRPRKPADQRMRRVVVTVPRWQFDGVMAAAQRRFESGEGVGSISEAFRLIVAAGLRASREAAA